MAMFKKVGRFVGITAILCSGGVISPSSTARQTQKSSVVSIQAALQRNHAKGSVPRSFLGFSIEWGLVSKLITPKQGRQTTLMHLMNRLKSYSGPLIVRLGGNSQDEAVYDSPSHKHLPKFIHINITKHTLQMLAKLASATDCKFVIGLNLADNRTDLAKQLVEHANTIIGSQHILAYEIGNEPDFLNRLGKIWRPDTFKSYLKRWTRYYKAIRPALEGSTQIEGPAFGGGWAKGIPRFIKQEHDRLNLVMLHRYPLGAPVKDRSSPKFTSIPNLLKNSAAASFARVMKPAVAAAKPYHLPVRFGEMNSAYGGGKKNVSDTFASTLWGIDTLFEIANAGGAGANIHMSQGVDGFPGYYGPVFFNPDQPLQIRPLFYSMWLFARAVQNHAQLIPVRYHTQANVKLWATEDDNHVIRLVVLNKDLSQNALIHIALWGYGEGRILRLHAPAITAKHHLRFGGKTFDYSKHGSVKTLATNQVKSTVESKNHRYELNVPHAGTAMVVFKPR